ncbi:unnamed protein product, partial [Staurois parvus]
MSCQSAPDHNRRWSVHVVLTVCLSMQAVVPLSRMSCAPLFWVCFECGQGHKGPMIPYCPGAP